MTLILDKNLYVFSFPPTAPVLYKLKKIDSAYILNPNNLEHYLQHLLHDQPRYILGVGSYSGVDQDKIRVETICTNRFRNGYLDDAHYVKKRVINSFISEGPLIKFANAIGNSYCNYVSWKIMELIQSEKLKSQYTFLHIPKKMKEEEVSKIIEHALS